MKGIMNLTEDKVKLIGYTFSVSLLIPPNVGLNVLGINFEDLPLIVLFSYLFYLKVKSYRKNNLEIFDSYFLIFFILFIIYTNIFVDNKLIFNQTNLRFYFYFFLTYLVISSFENSKNNIITIFESLKIVMVANLFLVIFQLELNGDLNGWISNNTASTNPFSSGRLGGLQGGGPNVIGIFCAITSLLYIYKILESKNKSIFSTKNIPILLMIFISLINLYITYSRGSYLAFTIGFLIILLFSNKFQNNHKIFLIITLLSSSVFIVYLNPSIILKPNNRTFLRELAIDNVQLFTGTGGGQYVKEVYKDYLITLEDNKLKKEFNINYSETEKVENKKTSKVNIDSNTSGYLKLSFDYKDSIFPRSIVSFFFSKDGSKWKQIGFDHSNGELINLIENDSYFEIGGWGDGQSPDNSYLSALINEVQINTENDSYIYEFPKYKRGIDYYILTPKYRNVYRDNIEYIDSGIQLERPRSYWLALQNETNLSKKDFEIIVNLELDGIPKGNETIFSQSSILRLNENFNDQSWKWSIVDGRMYFFWIDNVDNGYSNYLGGKSLRSGKLLSLNGTFDTSISDFDESQYDEITTSHNGFLTMAVEYGIFPVATLVILILGLFIKNIKNINNIELILFLMLIIQNLTNDLIYSPDVSIYFWLTPLLYLKNISKAR